MANYLFITTPSEGHVNPLLPISKTMVERGHAVTWINGSVFKEKVEKTGATFVPMHPKYDRGATDLYEFFPELKTLKGISMIRFYAKHWLLDPVPFYTAQIEAVLQRFAADVIVADSFRFCASFVTERGGPPVAMVNVFPLVYPSDHLPPSGIGMLPGKSAVSKLKERLLRFIVFRIAFGPVQEHCNEIRKGLGLPPYKTYYLKECIRRIPLVLQPTVPSFEYSCPDLPLSVHFIGPLRLGADAHYVEPSWWSLITSITWT